MQLVQFSRSAHALIVGLALFFCQNVPLGAQDLTGHWCGTWNDCKSGHDGPLRATFSKCDDQHYRAVFSGRFFKVIPFRFATTLEVTGHEGGKVQLSGQSRLGLFGNFSYNAEATDTNFTSHYSSRRYEGQFLLSR